MNKLYIYGASALAIIIGTAYALYWTYHEGEISCAPTWELKILKAQAKNREIALKYYQSAYEGTKLALGKTTKQSLIDKEQYDELVKKFSTVGSAPGDDDFIDGVFLRELSRLR